MTGYAYIAGTTPVQHAFITDARKHVMSDLGTLGGARSVGYGIDASGQVTGWSYTASGAYHAFVYSHGKMVDLNSLLSPKDATLYTPGEGRGINHRGKLS